MVTVDRLVNVLSTYGGRLCCCPLPRATALRSVAVHDPADPRPATGEVFLAVGAASAVEAVRWAARAQAAAVVLRDGGDIAEEVLDAARTAAVALIAVDPAVSWSQLSAVVFGLVLDGRESDAGRGPTDLFTLADSLAEEVGGPVTVEDRFSRVLAYSSRQIGADRARHETILGRRVPEGVRAAIARQGAFRHLDASDDPLFVRPSAAHGLHGRAVIAVRAGRELIGSIWVESEAPLTGPRAAALRAGATAAAQHMLRIRAGADLERRMESDCVIGLLEGSADTLGLLSRLGLASAPARVVALRAHGADSGHAAVLLAFERATLGFGWTRPGRSALSGSTVYTVLPGGGDVAKARAWIASVAEDLPAGVVVRAGIGGPAEPALLPASRSEADESLAVHALRDPAAPAVAYDEAWGAVLLERLRAAAAAGRTPARGPLHELRRCDAEQGTRHVPTLRAWLDAQGDVGAAAQRLGVHRNTVRYRMRQLAQVADLRLDDPEGRLALIIALAAQDPAAG
ncbi:DNA-binding PucR family transcriptional regulator [Murinocardiopsis flavida]|uniref:DNA-binding PucR family transcriptional regulator n=1 Tax=Murinocardiopsis flavida TaxID=645275 RepID=A0A2P8D9B2_9ACTN|nr:PucR family transcriptional regulator [Murinocardiopsis flavida]PSK93792.1 DNA-binding PucR family transcriptional regulator [Murinocardiopsis flavida]